MNIELILYLVIGLAALALVGGAYLVLFGSSITQASNVNRRLDGLSDSARRDEALEKLRKEMEAQLHASGIPIYAQLAAQARKSGLAITPEQLMMIMAGVAFAAYVALSVLTDVGMGLGIGLSLAVGIGGVYVYVSQKASKRYALLEEQLPDAIDLMVRSLRTGSPFSAALNMAAQEIPDPLATELVMVADEAAYGRDVGDSLKDMAERLEMQDLRFLSVAVSIALQSGGNLADILDGLSKTIRSRFKLMRKVKALTAEPKFSGNFLSAFPLIVIIGINLFQPDYYDEIRDTPYFVPGCFIVGFLLLLNLVVMRYLTTVKV